MRGCADRRRTPPAARGGLRRGRIDLGAFCLTLDADDHIAFEATGNSSWFRDQVRCCGGRVVVVNPAQFKVIRSSIKKTDRNDAAALALFLAKDMQPETRGKTQDQAELASLVHTCDLLVKQRTRLTTSCMRCSTGAGSS